MKISDTLKGEYTQFAMYASYRNIACYIDGLKPSSRKIVYTVRKNNIGPNKKTKVANLISETSSQTEYLHGEDSLVGVTVGMATRYVGANNIPIMYPSGNFGSRFEKLWSAKRYIYTYYDERFNELFHVDDDPLLISQQFEGKVIEPKYYVPTLPLLVINGSKGAIGFGYKQDILPRSEEEVTRYIKTKLNGKAPRAKFIPHFNGFKGNVLVDESGPNKYIIQGVFKRINTTKLEITEIPIKYQLEQYLKVLDKLVDDKVIKDYEDLSDDDQYNFIISTTREFTKHSDEKIYDILGLNEKFTEFYTCIDEDNSIRVFDNIKEIVDSYMDIRLEYYDKRKANILKDLNRELLIRNEKVKFITEIIKSTIEVHKMNKKDAVTLLEKKGYTKIDDSYNHLLNMPIYSLTKDTLKMLKGKIADTKVDIKTVKAKTNKSMWLDDIK